MKLPKKIIPKSTTDYNALNALQALEHCDVRNKKVLVVGCNRGKDCSYFVIAGAKEVHGLDVIDDIGSEFKHENVIYHKESAENMRSLSDDYFDLVYCFATMEHIPDISAAFREMARVCKPGGIVYSIASPLWYSAYGNHRENYFKKYPWIHLLLNKNGAKKWFMKNMAKKMPDIAAKIEKKVGFIFKDGNEVFNKRKSSEYLEVCDNLGLIILVNEVERDPSHKLTGEALKKLLQLHGEAELMGMTHRFVGRKKFAQFSIIIPTYNASGLLPSALDSVLAQTFSDYEVILVDGNSTDGTQEIVKKYEKKFGGKLRWVSESDEGIYDAMNKGLGLAKGEWIYFLGSDDTFYSKNVLEKVNKEIKNSNVDVIYGSVQWGDLDKVYDGEFSLLKIMQKNICHQAIFYKKDLFKRLGKYDLNYKTWADYLFNIRWFNNRSVKHKYIDLIVAKYGANGFSSSIEDEQFLKERGEIVAKYFPKEYSETYQLIKHQEKIIKDMRASIFWKLREHCYRFKSLFFKNHS